MYKYIIILFILLSFTSEGICQQGKMRDTVIGQQFIKGMMLSNDQVTLYRQCRNAQRRSLDSIKNMGISDRDSVARAMRTAVARYRNLFYNSLNDEQKRRFDLLEKAQKEKYLQAIEKKATQTGQTPQQ